MKRWIWIVNQHLVVLEGKRVRETVMVDGKVVSDVDSRRFFNEHHFFIDGKKCEIVISCWFIYWPKCKLICDGKEIAQFKNTDNLPSHLRDLLANSVVPEYTKLIPTWLWLGLTLLCALPGWIFKVPYWIGFVAVIGAIGCMQLCRNRASKQTFKSRIVNCLGIIAFCWLLMIITVLKEMLMR